MNPEEINIDNVLLPSNNHSEELQREISILLDVLSEDIQITWLSDESTFNDFGFENEAVQKAFDEYFGEPVSEIIDVSEPVWKVVDELKLKFPDWPEDQEWLEYVVRHFEAQMADAQMDLAVRYVNGSNGVSQNFEKAFHWYEKAASAGNARAVTNMALLYVRGHGVTQDYAKATKFLLDSAEKGDDAAQFYLATFFAEGVGVPTDPHQAFYWFRTSAEQGHPVAQYYLGQCYKDGFGVERNEGQSKYWYGKAAEQGVDDESERQFNKTNY